MNIKRETTNKIGFFTAISMFIGSVIGIGIFLKNGGIFINNNYNAIGIIVSWSIGSLIALSSAISFAEVGTTIKSRSGLSGWTEKLWGKKIGHFVKVVQPLFYLGLMIPIISLFSSESLVQIFNDGKGNMDNFHFGWIVLISIALLFMFVIFNFFSLKSSGIFSFITTILKFIPLGVIIVWGIVFAILNKSGGFFDEGAINPEGGLIPGISVEGILASLPSILFAFDSFTNVGNLSLDIKKPDRNVPLVISVGMILCSMFYLLVTISQILFMEGNSIDLFANIIKDNPKLNLLLSIILKVFITISIIGVLNALTATGLRSYTSLIDDKLLFCYKKVERISFKIFPKFNSDIKSGFLLSFFIHTFWFLIIGIPTVLKGPLGSDVYVDGISNYPTLFFFGIYGFVILGGIINRWTKKVDVKKQKGFLIAAPIAVIGSFLVFGYQFFFESLYKAIHSPKEYLSWGLFFSNGIVIQRWEGMLFFFSFLTFFIAIPFINIGLFKVFNKNEKLGEIDIIQMVQEK